MIEKDIKRKYIMTILKHSYTDISRIKQRAEEAAHISELKQILTELISYFQELEEYVFDLEEKVSELEDKLKEV